MQHDAEIVVYVTKATSNSRSSLYYLHALVHESRHIAIGSIRACT